MVSPKAVGMIAELIPDPRFIFIFRNPVDRAWSHYSWVTGRYGRQPQTFRDAFLQDFREASRDPMPVNHGYYHTGQYDRWLRMYLDGFGSQRVFVVIFEDFVVRPLETLDRIFRFLRVDPLEHLELRQANKSEIMRFPTILRFYSEAGRVGGKLVRHVLPQPAQVKLLRLYRAGDQQLGRRMSLGRPPEIDEDARAWLAGFYRDSVESLRTLTGLSLGAWERDFPRASNAISEEPTTVAE
jgi:hypothetical protein